MLSSSKNIASYVTQRNRSPGLAIPLRDSFVVLEESPTYKSSSSDFMLLKVLENMHSTDTVGL